MTLNHHHRNDQLPRSIQWRSWLGVFQGLETSGWVKQTSVLRQNYSDLLAKFTAAPVNDDEDLQINNPLSQHQQSSWSKFFKTADLQSTIDLDLVRTHPTKTFFQSATTQTQMRHMLLVWAQLHPAISYRQGMNELLAPIIMTRSHDAENLNEFSSEDIRLLSDKEFIEHDSFALFQALMLHMSSLFTSESQIEQEPQVPTIVARSEYIQNVLLKQFDFELYSHLSKVGVQPQLYGLRWLRLLLAREFHLQDILFVWDAIFQSNAENRAHNVYSLSLVDYICVAMLQFVRQDLIAGDHSTCIKRLLSYPPVEDISIIIDRAGRLQKGEELLENGSFVHTSPSLDTESDGNQHSFGKVLIPIHVEETQIPNCSGKEASSENQNQVLGANLEDLVAVMQCEIRKGQLECDQSLLLQCLAKIKLIKDVLIGNLPFESVADDIKASSHPLQ